MNKFIVLLSCATLVAEEQSIEKISETMGHLIGKNLQSLGLPLNIDAIVKGMKDEASGKTAPLVEEEYESAIATLQEASHEKAALANLKQAEEFLKNNESQEGVLTLETGKLQYKIEKKGNGKTVQSYNTPLIRYQGKFLNGEPLQGDCEEELLSLDEAIAGLRQGIAGMKEGEVRTLYIHPDRAYGKEHYIPNTLLIFEVEVLKADTSAETQVTADSETLPNSSAPMR